MSIDEDDLRPRVPRPGEDFEPRRIIDPSEREAEQLADKMRQFEHCRNQATAAILKLLALQNIPPSSPAMVQLAPGFTVLVLPPSSQAAALYHPSELTAYLNAFLRVVEPNGSNIGKAKKVKGS